VVRRPSSQPDRAGEINQRPHGVITDEVERVPCVSVHGDDTGRVGQHRTCMGHHERVVIDIDDPRVRDDRPGRLMHVRAGRQPGPHVNELVNALPGQVLYRADQEIPVSPCQVPPGRDQRQRLLGRFPVGREMILAAKLVIAHRAGNHSCGLGAPCNVGLIGCRPATAMAYRQIPARG
jgi:hypothetical protein